MYQESNQKKENDGFAPPRVQAAVQMTIVLSGLGLKISTDLEGSSAWSVGMAQRHTTSCLRSQMP